MLYIGILILLVLASYYYDYKGYSFRKNELFILCCVIFITVIGFRYRIGGDSLHYEKQYFETPLLYNLFSHNITDFKFEPGFTLLLSIFRTIFPDTFIPFQLTLAIFINVIIFRFYYKYSVNPFLAIILYYFYYYFYFNCEILRQAIAICIFLSSWKYFIEHKWIKYYSLTVIALSFHSSAIVCILLPILYIPILRSWFQINYKYCILLISTIIFVVLSNTLFIEYIYQINLFSGLTDTMDSYSTRIQTESSINLNNLINGFLKNIIYPITALLTATYYVKNKKKSTSVQFIIAINGILGLASVGIDMIFRLCAYFFPFIILVLSQWCFKPIKIKRCIYNLSYPIWFIIMIPMLISPINNFNAPIEGTSLKMGMRYYPYNSIFFQEKDINREKLIQYMDS